MEKHGAQRERILALLREAGLTAASARAVAEETGVPEADVWGAGSFYELLAHGPQDRRVCQGLSCILQGAAELEAGEGQLSRPVTGRRWSSVEDLGVIHAGRPRGGVTPDDPELPMNLAGADRADYAALARRAAMGRSAVLEALEASGLQGRGGAGFPAHIKWRAVRSQPPGQRYVVCNADEGEPGTFKDREIMLRRPHLLLEGLAIAAETVRRRCHLPLRPRRVPRGAPQLRAGAHRGAATFAGGLRLALRRGPRRLYLRRGDRPHREHRGPPGHAPDQAALPHRGGLSSASRR